MLDEEEIMGREPLPPVVDDFEEEAAYEEEQRLLRSPSGMTFSAEEGMAVADQTDGNDRTITTNVTNVRPTGQLEPVEERPEGKFTRAAVQEIFDSVPVEQGQDTGLYSPDRVNAQSIPVGRSSGDLGASAPRQITEETISVDQPGQLRATAMEPARQFGSNAASDAMDERRAAASGRVGDMLPQDRREPEEFEADMTFSEEEGQAAADQYEQEEAEREQRRGMSLDDLLVEATEGAQDREPTVTDEALELALNRLGEGASPQEAAADAAEQSAEPASDTDAMSPAQREAQEARGREERLRRIFAIGQALRGLGAVVAGIAGAEGATGILAQNISAANEREMSRVTGLAERAEQRAARQQEQDYRDRQLAQQQSQFEDQQSLRERQEERADRELDLTAEQAELQNQMSRLEIAAQERGNELVSPEELGRIWGAYSGAGRTSDMTRDEFIAQEITNSELNDTLGERFPMPRRGRRGGSGRRGRRGSGTSTTPTLSEETLAHFSNQVDSPGSWNDEQMRMYTDTDATTQAAIIAGYRPPGWNGPNSPAVNPDRYRETMEASEARITGLNARRAEISEAMEAARRLPLRDRLANHYLPAQGRVLGSNTGREVLVRHPNATMDDDEISRQLTASANMRDVTAEYQSAFNRLSELAETEDARAAAMSMSPNDFIAWLGTNNHPNQAAMQAAMSDMSEAAQVATSLIREAENWGAVTLGERQQVMNDLGNPDQPINYIMGTPLQRQRAMFTTRMNNLANRSQRALEGGENQTPQVRRVPNTFTAVHNGRRTTMTRPQAQRLIMQIYRNSSNTAEAHRRIRALGLRSTGELDG